MASLESLMRKPFLLHWNLNLILVLILIVCGGCGEQRVEKKAERKKPPLFKSTNQWLESHPEAVAQSQSTGKPILAFFTGSDWCKYCGLLDHQVLSSPVFSKWAKENVILLKLDFPREQKLSEELESQNKALMARYRVTGFPTVIVMNAEGEPLAQAGYEPVSAEEWIQSLEQQLGKTQNADPTENPNTDEPG